MVTCQKILGSCTRVDLSEELLKSVPADTIACFSGTEKTMLGCVVLTRPLMMEKWALKKYLCRVIIKIVTVLSHRPYSSTHGPPSKHSEQNCPDGNVLTFQLQPVQVVSKYYNFIVLVIAARLPHKRVSSTIFIRNNFVYCAPPFWLPFPLFFLFLHSIRCSWPFCRFDASEGNITTHSAQYNHSFHPCYCVKFGQPIFEEKFGPPTNFMVLLRSFHQFSRKPTLLLPFSDFLVFSGFRILKLP